VSNIWNCDAATKLRAVLLESRTENSAAFSGTKTTRPRARKFFATTATTAIQ
jgi:hypothetical protein